LTRTTMPPPLVWTMADETHAHRPARPSLESLEARIATLEDNYRGLMPLVQGMAELKSGQIAMRQDIADFAGWLRDERAKDATEALLLRDVEIARAAVAAADAKLTAAKDVRRQHRQKWLRPLLQGLAAMSLIVLTELVSSLHDAMGAYIDDHTGWGVAGFLGLAILVALVSLALAIRAA
jgi:hypothetical protein